MKVRAWDAWMPVVDFGRPFVIASPLPPEETPSGLNTVKKYHLKF